MHLVRTSIKDNEIMNTARKVHMLEAVSTEKREPWSANKFSKKDASIENSGRRNSRFKICKYDMFITMCQLTSFSVDTASNILTLRAVFIISLSLILVLTKCIEAERKGSWLLSCFAILATTFSTTFSPFTIGLKYPLVPSNCGEGEGDSGEQK